MGEPLSDEEMDDFLSWLGLRVGGSINMSTFKKLPCWKEIVRDEDNPSSKKSMFSGFSETSEKINGPVGTVSVRVVRGTGLMAADRRGTSDPYVVVQPAGGKKAKTSAKKKTLDPEWDETLEMSVYDAAAAQHAHHYHHHWQCARARPPCLLGRAWRLWAGSTLPEEEAGPREPSPAFAPGARARRLQSR